jgi:hypothetical protein
MEAVSFFRLVLAIMDHLVQRPSLLLHLVDMERAVLCRLLLEQRPRASRERYPYRQVPRNMLEAASVLQWAMDLDFAMVVRVDACLLIHKCLRLLFVRH